ncbi:MAG: dctA [Gemmatimonadetes bacterium]|nr:dctA [Gemmatimonadota bacterium]
MSTATAAPRRPRLGPLWLQVLVAIALGAAVGAFAPAAGVALKPLGDAFVKLIRLTLAPIIFGTVVVGIARVGDLREVGRVGIKALVYFEVVSTIALLMGVVAVEWLRPGAGMHIDPRTLDAAAVSSYAASAQQLDVVSFLLDVIPSSIAGAFATNSILQIVFFAVLFGVALAPMRERAAPLVDLLELGLQAMFGVVRIVMVAAPLGAFGAMAFTVGRYGMVSLLQLATLTAEVWIVSALFVVVVLGLIARWAGFSLFRFLRFVREEILIALGTSSSEAVLAPLMTKIERLGCARSVVGLVMPTGYTFNADGTAIYLGMCALFVAQATDVSLSLRDKVVVVLVLMLTSKGSAGVAGAGFVALAASLASLHTIPVAGIVLLLGVDRLTNAARAVTNVIGNGVATIVVAKWEGALDSAQLSRALRDPEAKEISGEPS